MQKCRQHHPTVGKILIPHQWKWWELCHDRAQISSPGQHGLRRTVAPAKCMHIRWQQPTEHTWKRERINRHKIEKLINQTHKKRKELEIEEERSVENSPVRREVPKGEIWWVYYVGKRRIDFVSHYDDKRSYQEEERENPQEQGCRSETSLWWGHFFAHRIELIGDHVFPALY